jgi:hypothetical protein
MGKDLTLYSPSNSVRIWRGYKQQDTEMFFKELGDIFIPVTIQFMSPNGLTAYFPLILPEKKEANVPDELALVFYSSQEQYHNASKNTSTGRAYGKLHISVFDLPNCHSEFPIPFSKVLENGSYYLFGGMHNWRSLNVECVILKKADNLKQYESYLLRLKTERTEGINEIFVSIDDYHIYTWICKNSAYKTTLEILSEKFDILLHFDSIPLPINPNITADNKISITGGEFFNTQF